MDEVENLLQPLFSDLRANFNIDLSKHLKAYRKLLQEKFSDHESLLNFAQAAMVLHNSCEIYGRKVDYLHGSVMQLMELINSGCEKPQEGDGEGYGNGDSPVKLAKKRKLVTPSALLVEDFESLNCEVKVKSPTLSKHYKRKQKSRVRELGFGRLVTVQQAVSHECYIYDDALVALGRKDDYRSSWAMDQSCCVSEDIIDRGAAARWSIFDERVGNMPTPEYSDDDACHSPPRDENCHNTPSNSEPVEQQNFNDAPLNPEPMGHENVEIELPPVAASSVSAQRAVVVNDQDVQLECTKLSNAFKLSLFDLERREKSPNAKKVFKLPPEIRKKIQAGENRKKFMTLFLFSNMLKRSLGSKSFLLPYRDLKTEKARVAQHVRNVMKRHRLESRQPINTQSLTSAQDDFLGFDDVELPPENAEGDGGEHNLEEATRSPEMLTPPCSQSASPCLVLPRSSEIQDGYSADALRHMQEYQQRKAANGAQSKENVAVWQAVIESRLRNSKSQRSFDVHKYGSDILGVFSDIGDTIPFTSLAGGLDTPEVARYFVSSLMLANTENVLLEENGCDTLSLTLLSRERHHDMEEFLVPSAVGGLAPLPEHVEQVLLPEEAEVPNAVLVASPQPGPSGLVNPLQQSFSSDDSIAPCPAQALKKTWKRPSSDDNDESGVRPRKQKPGVGPWVVKSLKAKEDRKRKHDDSD